LYRKAQPRLAESKAGQESRDSAWYGSAILWSVTPATTVPIYHRPLTRAQSIALVLGCTILGAAAQMLMKIGLSHVSRPGLMGYITSVPLFGGYCLYGLNTVLMVFALRDGELSILYPIIALTYVWVTILSVIFFHETLNLFKLVGIAVVVTGVAVMGRGGKT
jgi:multidrug transporter EmrE-like cation transporter